MGPTPNRIPPPLYSGGQAIAEYDGSNNLLRRFVPGAGVDETVTWYEGSTLTNRSWIAADARGSVLAVMDGTGAATATNKYDPYGVPASTNSSYRFGYTGQMYLPEIKLSHHKARAYNPETGRFLQPDPIGYGDGLNLYAYTGNDPVNFTDPSGLKGDDFPTDHWADDPATDVIVVTGTRPAGGSCEGYCFSDPAGIRDVINSGADPIDLSALISSLLDALATSREAAEKDKEEDDCSNAPTVYPSPEDYEGADPANRFIRPAGSPPGTPLQVNPAYQQHIDSSRINWNGVRADLMSIMLTSVTGGLFGAASSSRELFFGGVLAAGAAADQEMSHKDQCSE